VEVVVCVIDTRLEGLNMNERASGQWLARKEAWNGMKRRTMEMSRDAVSYMQLVRLLPLVFLCLSVFDILSL